MCKLKKYLYGAIVASLVLCSSINVFAERGGLVEQEEQKQEQTPSGNETQNETPSKGGKTIPDCMKEVLEVAGSTWEASVEWVQDHDERTDTDLTIGDVGGKAPTPPQPEDGPKTKYVDVQAKDLQDCLEQTDNNKKYEKENGGEYDNVVTTCSYEVIDGLDFVLGYLESEPHSITEEERKGEVEKQNLDE